ncbi:MAG: hypothetical protein PHR96_01985 [Clostridia bacterium]|nr:hypothetical protein [Clostridia bacterium]
MKCPFDCQLVHLTGLLPARTTSRARFDRLTPLDLPIELIQNVR